MMGNHHLVLFFTLTFAFMVPAFLARTVNYQVDDYIKEQVENARKAAMEAYHPHPELSVAKFAKQIDESLKGTNSTRRNLQGTTCQATNPIDMCWRCKGDWAENRQALAQCALGFGQGTTGGMGGEIYVVTDYSDDDAKDPKPGTLRYGVVQDRPLWIIFSESMVIHLKHELVINHDKTIDGRGVKVEIAHGAGLTMQHVTNVIIHGIHIHHTKETEGGMIKTSETKVGPRSKADGDAIKVYGSSKIWIDHVTLDNGPDGLIDVTMGSTAVTVSNCKFSDHDKVMLLGADDGVTEDEIMQVTVAFNKFAKGCVQRMPRCRFGFFHVVNNDYEKWGMYAIGGSARPTIISQGNRFVAPDENSKKQVTLRNNATEAEWKNWNWKSENDLFLNGAYFVASGIEVQQKDHMVQAQPASDVEMMTHAAGVIACLPGQPC